MSNWALATSIPTKHGMSLIRTPVHPTSPIRAQWHQTTVRALGVQDVTTHAPLRSRRTKAKTVYHVRAPSAGESPTPLIIKIQGWRQSGSGERHRLPGALPTEPDVKVALLRFLGSHPRAPLAHHTGDTPCGASLGWPWPCEMGCLILGCGRGSGRWTAAPTFCQLRWPVWLRLLRPERQARAGCS